MTSRSDKTAACDGERPRSKEEHNTGQARADLAAEAAPGDRALDEDLQQRQDQLLVEAATGEVDAAAAATATPGSATDGSSAPAGPAHARQQ